jgi:hypothetical protein
LLLGTYLQYRVLVRRGPSVASMFTGVSECFPLFSYAEK